MKWKEKLGNYLIDLSKYFFTGVFVSSLLKNMEGLEILIQIVGFTVTIVFLLIGLVLTEKTKED
jgi:uncharacterized membrane protein